MIMRISTASAHKLPGASFMSARGMPSDPHALRHASMPWSAERVMCPEPGWGRSQDAPLQVVMSGMCRHRIVLPAASFRPSLPPFRTIHRELAYLSARQQSTHPHAIAVQAVVTAGGKSFAIATATAAAAAAAAAPAVLARAG